MGFKSSTGLTWCLPLSPVQLVAHLHAYINAKPSVTTLRLCHRFGTGDKAVIHKLPQELLDSIIDKINHGHRKECMEEWTMPPTCFEEECRTHEHLTHAEKREIRSRSRKLGYPCTEEDGRHNLASLPNH
jgi:hypothetical protein